jgi:squalene-associated FAD-dependent desaturase
MFGVKPGSKHKRIAIVGAGWAGCAAAVELARSGYVVTLFEATRMLGGRARRVDLDGKQLDNGQHILLGAYQEILRLMRICGIDRKHVLRRLPMQMRYPHDSGGMDFIAPKLPAPLHLVMALIHATGLERADKVALARFSTTARWMGWRMDHDCSVTELLERFDQTPRLIGLMWRPLCIAALNTPPERASAQIFLNVLRDSLGARRRAASDMLLPIVNLSVLLPQHAADFVRSHAGALKMGATVKQITRVGAHWQLSGQTHAEAWTEAFDGIILATQASHAAQLLDHLTVDPASTSDTTDTPDTHHINTDTTLLHELRYEPITTCYLQYSPATRLIQPFFALLDDPAKSHWGQFVFDRGQLDARQAGLLAVVISASDEAVTLGQSVLAAAIAKQLATVLQQPLLANPVWSKVISEKRATFACSPGLQRPDNATGWPTLMLAGDYTAGEYPATLEAAVRSGVRAAKLMEAGLG